VGDAPYLVKEHRLERLLPLRAATVRKLARNVRSVFDYLRMTDNSIPRSQLPCAQTG